MIVVSQQTLAYAHKTTESPQGERNKLLHHSGQAQVHNIWVCSKENRIRVPNFLQRRKQVRYRVTVAANSRSCHHHRFPLIYTW